MKKIILSTITVINLAFGVGYYTDNDITQMSKIDKSSYKEFTAKITDWDENYTYVFNVKTHEKYVINNSDVPQKYKIGSLVNVQYFGDGEKMNVTDFKNK